MNEHDMGKLLIYQNEKGDTKIDVHFDNDDIWMTQKSLAELYQVRIPTINEHIKTILADGELTEEATIRNFLIVQQEGAICGPFAAKRFIEAVNRNISSCIWVYDDESHLPAICRSGFRAKHPSVRNTLSPRASQQAKEGPQ